MWQADIPSLAYPADCIIAHALILSDLYDVRILPICRRELFGFSFDSKLSAVRRRICLTYTSENDIHVPR